MNLIYQKSNVICPLEKDCPLECYAAVLFCVCIVNYFGSGFHQLLVFGDYIFLCCLGRVIGFPYCAYNFFACGGGRSCVNLVLLYYFLRLKSIVLSSLSNFAWVRLIVCCYDLCLKI